MIDDANVQDWVSVDDESHEYHDHTGIVVALREGEAQVQFGGYKCEWFEYDQLRRFNAVRQ